MTPLAPEAILDAALDDDTFAALPLALARAVGGRSAVMHWSAPGASGELRHSQYFSDAQIALLDHDYDGHDLWADAVRGPHAIGRVWNLDTLVSARAYQDGRLYNDWIRAIGDDSFHGLGFAARVGGVTMEVGVHRGRGQGGFSDAAVATLRAMQRPLEQLLQVRARFARTEIHSATARAALDAQADPVLVVRPGGLAVNLNPAAEALVAAGDVLALRGGRLRAVRAADDARLQRVLADGGALSDTVELVDRSGRRHLLSIDGIFIDGRRHWVVLVRSPALTGAAKRQRVARLYGLSGAESEVAIAIAAGLTAAEIADARATSLHTIRSQIKAVLGKMGMRRQSEVAAAIAVLPGADPGSPER